MDNVAMKRLAGESDKSAFELLEEATHLVRSAPPTTLATYYAGAIPFVVALLYFWADMSRSPFAGQHTAEGALMVTAAFLWMKFCQAVFAQRLLAQVAAQPVRPWDTRRALRVIFNQAVIQPTGLFLIPLALISAVPFGWVYAFYQTATVLDDGETGEIRDLVRRAWRQTSLWPYQNHIAIAIASLFGICIFVNWFLVCLAIPRLVKMLFGIDSVFNRSALSMLNTTFISAILGVGSPGTELEFAL